MTMIGRCDRLAVRVVERINAREPELLAKYGDRGGNEGREDNFHAMRHHASAFNMYGNKNLHDLRRMVEPACFRRMETCRLTDAYRLIDESLPLVDCLTEPERTSSLLDLQAAVARLASGNRPAPDRTGYLEVE